MGIKLPPVMQSSLELYRIPEEENLLIQRICFDLSICFEKNKNLKTILITRTTIRRDCVLPKAQVYILQIWLHPVELEDRVFQRLPVKALIMKVMEMATTTTM